MINCPNCGKENNESEMMCYFCGEDLDSAKETRKSNSFKNRQEQKMGNPLMINEDFLIIKQQVEWLESFTSYETENRYAILNQHGDEQYFAEERSSFWARMFLPSQRPLDIEVFNNYGNQVMAIRKPFRFFVPEIKVYNENDKSVSIVKKKFWSIRRTFFVYDNSGNEIYKIIGPIFHPWTFKIMKDGKELGKISKKWSGIGKEMFTDADTFNVQFPNDASDEEKKIFVGATFLIDLMYFENNTKR
jgi:uncharacterized protein YxjI